MRLYTTDEKRTVDVGTGSIWYSIYSTAVVTLSNEIKKSIPDAMDFLKNGDCKAEKVQETKIQLLAIKEAFSAIEPEKAVYDLHKPDMAPPWAGNIAPSVTSCANLYTTADGEDMFDEVISLLTYAEKQGVSVLAG